MTQLRSLLRATHSCVGWFFIWSLGVLFWVHSVLGHSGSKVSFFCWLPETVLSFLRPCSDLCHVPLSVFKAIIREFPLCQILITFQIFHQEESHPFYGLTDEVRLGQFWHIIWPKHGSHIPTHSQVLPTLKGKGLYKIVGHCGPFYHSAYPNAQWIR